MEVPMVLTNRGNNEMFIDLKQAKMMPKVLVDALERELPRALKMAPAADIINMSIQTASLQEYDRNDANAALVADVLAKQDDLNATIKQLQAVTVAKDKEIARLSAAAE